ncbi:response regulator [Streptomyces cavourensis]
MGIMTDLAEHRGTTVTPEAIEFIRGLHGSAFDSSSSPKHAVEIIEQQLADADHVSRRSSVRGGILGDALLERQLAAVEHPVALPAAPPLRMPKVLVVDDQPDSLLAMTAVLETLDQELVTVSSGRDALKALLHHDDFAVITMDVQMPEMDGYETAAHIKRRPRNRDVPIIFLTAMGVDPEHTARGYAAGAVDYISKPFDPWALRAKVAVFTEIHLERRIGPSE